MSKIKLISMREYIKRKMEIFKRITAKQLAELIETQKEEDSLLESPEPRKDDEYDDEEDKRSVTNGRTYLVLDLRDSERYTACHVYGAMNFPARLIRADRTRDIYKYKNRMRDGGFCFIVYDNDERVAVSAAKTLVEKGWDNVLLLTKGLSYFGQKYSDLIVGDAPVPDTPRSTVSTSSTSRRRGHRGGAGSRRVRRGGK